MNLSFPRPNPVSGSWDYAVHLDGDLIGHVRRHEVSYRGLSRPFTSRGWRAARPDGEKLYDHGMTGRGMTGRTRLEAAEALLYRVLTPDTRVRYASGRDHHPAVGALGRIRYVKPADPDRGGLDITVAWDSGGEGTYSVNDLDLVPVVRFTADDPAALWREGDTADDLGWESDHRDAPPIRLLRLHRTDELLSLTSPYEAGVIARVSR
jgi:hypothetical protein